MKLTEKQKNIIYGLIQTEKLRYNIHGAKLDKTYLLELNKLEEKMNPPQEDFEKKMIKSMETHSEREDW